MLKLVQVESRMGKEIEVLVSQGAAGLFPNTTFSNREQLQLL